MGKNSKEREIKAKMDVLIEQRRKELQIKNQKFQLAQNCYILKFFEEQIKSGDIIIKDKELIAPAPLSMEMMLKNAYAIRAAIEEGIFNLKNFGLSDKEIEEEIENHRKNKYIYLMVE